MSLVQIDRSVYRHLLNRLVAANLTVDPAAYVPGQEALYEAALQAAKLANGTGAVLKLSGVGATESRDGLEDSKIVIDRAHEDPGSVGAAPTVRYHTYDDNGVTKFRKVRMFGRTYDLGYEIRYFTKVAAMDRAIRECISLAFGEQKYIPRYSPVDGTPQEGEDMLFVRFTHARKMLGTEFIERVIRIEFTDVTIVEEEVLQDGIVQLTEIIPVVEGLYPFPPITADEFVDVSGLSCAVLNHPDTGLTQQQIINCLLGRIDFSDTDTQNHLTAGQVAQLEAWLGAASGTPVSVLRALIGGGQEEIASVPAGGSFQVSLTSIRNTNDTFTVDQLAYVHGGTTYVLRPVAWSYVDASGSVQQRQAVIVAVASGRYTTDQPVFPQFRVLYSNGTDVYATRDITSPVLVLSQQQVRNTEGDTILTFEVDVVPTAPDGTLKDADGNFVLSIPSGEERSVNVLSIVDDTEPYGPLIVTDNP